MKYRDSRPLLSIPHSLVGVAIVVVLKSVHSLVGVAIVVVLRGEVYSSILSSEQDAHRSVSIDVLVVGI